MVKRKRTMMFSLRITPLLVFVYVLIGIGVSGCIEVVSNVTAQGEKKEKPSKSDDKTKVFKKTTILEVEVRTAVDTPLPPAEVNDIFRDANKIAKSSDDGAEDVECPLEIVLANNAVEKFNSPQIIRDRHDINELNKFNGVKVVQEIWWCDEFWPDIIGCQWDNGIFVVRTLRSLEPILALHEGGHANNLPHRNEPNAVMNEFIRPMNTYLNASECGQYR